MAMMRAATEAFMPRKPTPTATPEARDELTRLREQMARMQQQLDALDK